MSNAKAIDIGYSQAIPAAAFVNREACLYFEQRKCAICLPVCQAKAIDFTQKRKKGIMRVGAIIVSPGCEVFDAKVEGEYAYGRMKNVVNSLEFERILDADGPYKGEILRPSDGKVPSKIAWLQCVGSRDTRLSRTYCSSICCTYAIKQAVLVRHHYPESRVAIFHNDIRTYGKGYEDLYNRAQTMDGVRFVRKRTEIIEDTKTNNLMVCYVSDNRTIQEEFDMVVLSVGLDPSKGNKSLARTMGLELNEHGFCRTGSFSPNEMNGRQGIFPAATFTGPMDIPDSISSAAGAGSLAAQLLYRQRGSLTKEKAYPPESSVAGEIPKIGVFICHCGTNIAGVASLPSLVQYASTLRDVVHCEDQLISCASNSLQKISEIIRDKGLNRVVVAACTPRSHESVFREGLREAGLNPYLLEMANIREHCAWAHSRDKEEATQKAKDIIAMSVARARNLSPIKEIQLPVNKKGLVLGGGLAGMTAATALAGQGFEVYLLEKESELGGNLRNLHYTLEGEEIQPFLGKLKSKVGGEEKITVFKGYELKSVSGFKGNFRSTLGRINSHDSATVDLEHGIIIVATGGKVAKPAEYRYGETKKVVIQQELEDMIASGAVPSDLKQVAMIQCVGARNNERSYCSRICCGQALKNALKLKEMNETLDIFVFYRDIRSYGFREDYYLQARKKGIQFIRYEPGKNPEVDIKGDTLSLTFCEPILAIKGEINPDLLVLSTPVIPEGSQEVARLLKLPLTGDGFHMEAHMKLRPLDFSMEGIFLCGMTHYPKYIPETISQANGAALRAATVLSKDTVESSGAVCEIEADQCIGCSLCENACPYSAISVQETEEEKTAIVVPAICKGCGICSSVCPKNAISIKHSTDQQIFSQIDAAYSVPMEKPQTKILAPKFIYQAYLKGIDAVLVVGCHLPDCHYVSGVEQTIKAVAANQRALEKTGINPERLRLEHVSAAEGAKYAGLVTSFAAAMEELGSLELDGKQKERLLKLKEQSDHVVGVTF
jgi:heterodisulfide reductase subunit A